jgi:muramoyltetrapeptide carboxypeptidase LdcA involved in peptidoglycan recycling
VRLPRVHPGDAVAIVSPSFGAVATWPHRAERGIAYLESLGLRVKVMPHANEAGHWTSGPPEARAADLHEAFTDPEVAVVLCSTGGNHSNQVLPHLDFDLIRANPKIFQGYSDMTVLHWALAKTAGVPTFYGPALVPELGEFPHVLPDTDAALRAAWFGDEPLRFTPAGTWTDEFLDWNLQLDLTRPRELHASEGWVTVRSGLAEGPLIGGCLETICWHLKGSSYWPDFDGAVLMLESSEEKPPPSDVDSYLTDLAQLGVLDAIAGLVYARPYGYDDEERRLLWSVLGTHARCPTLANVDCGHADPMLTLPLGQRVRVDADAQTLETLEPPTSNE